LNYGGGEGKILACQAVADALGHHQRQVQITSSALSRPDWARSVKRWATR
jgi:tRNA G37 N-methylase TrmD